MSQENVEIVRRWWASLESGELPFDLTDENVQIDNIEQPVVEGAYHGHDGLRRWWQDFAEAFDDIHFEVLDYTALDAQRVLTENRSQGHFRETGLPIDLRWASMFSVRDGKVVHAAGYLSSREGPRPCGAGGLGARSSPRRLGKNRRFCSEGVAHHAERQASLGPDVAREVGGDRSSPERRARSTRCPMRPLKESLLPPAFPDARSTPTRT